MQPVRWKQTTAGDLVELLDELGELAVREPADPIDAAVVVEYGEYASPGVILHYTSAQALALGGNSGADYPLTQPLLYAELP